MSLICIGDWSGSQFGLHTPDVQNIGKIAAISVPRQAVGAPVPTPMVREFLDPIQQPGGTCFAAAPVNFLRYLLPNLPQRSINALAWEASRMLFMTDDAASSAAPNGGWLRCSIAAMCSIGLPAASVCDDTTGAFIKDSRGYERLPKPHLAAMLSAYEAIVDIESLHQLRVREALDLAAQGHASLICTPVQDEIEDAALDFAGDFVLQGEGRYIGGHVWTLLCAHPTKADVWVLQSTWRGCGWQQKSLFLASGDWLRSVAFDMWTGVPRLRKAAA